MTAVIKGQRTCDSRCHNAKSDECNCVCGGKNHGVGFEIAVDYTRELTDDELRAIEGRGGMVAEELRQQTLFPE